MTKFAGTVVGSQLFRLLRSITLTHSPGTWVGDVHHLLSSAHQLQRFQMYSSVQIVGDSYTEKVFLDIVGMHCSRLLHFSVQRIVMDPETVQSICTICPQLEELFIVLLHEHLVRVLVQLYLAMSQLLDSLSLVTVSRQHSDFKLSTSTILLRRTTAASLFLSTIP